MNLWPVEHFFPHFLTGLLCHQFICTKITSYKIYTLVNAKTTIRMIAQIFVAFSEKLKFNEDDRRKPVAIEFWIEFLKNFAACCSANEIWLEFLKNSSIVCSTNKIPSGKVEK